MELREWPVPPLPDKFCSAICWANCPHRTPLNCVFFDCGEYGLENQSGADHVTVSGLGTLLCDTFGLIIVGTYFWGGFCILSAYFVPHKKRTVGRQSTVWVTFEKHSTRLILVSRFLTTHKTAPSGFDRMARMDFCVSRRWSPSWPHTGFRWLPRRWQRGWLPGKQDPPHKSGWRSPYIH